MADIESGTIRDGELLAQRIKMSDVGGCRVSIWSIQDTELNTVHYSLVNTRVGKSVESDSLEYLEHLYDVCIQRITMELSGGGGSNVGIA